MNISLAGSTALVTGAATGIGAAIAATLAAAGVRVAINHMNQGGVAKKLMREIQAGGGDAIAIDADVTDSDQVREMIEQTEEALGPLQILINNAGVILDKPFLELTEQDWDRIVDTDLKAVFLCCRAALPGMQRRKRGTVINIASELGYLGRAGFAPYCAAKAGVIGLTRSLAREFAPAIRINAIAPGPVNTAMLSLEQVSAEVRAQEAAIPACRVGEPHEIAATALFLASDLASFYYGQVLGPNGGAAMY
jgi:3-oxoacyl-[acyl-carrier protein] reductase